MPERPEAVPVARHIHQCPVKQPTDDARRFVKSVDSVSGAPTKVDAVDLMFFLRPSSSQAAHRSTATYVIEGHRHLRDQRRMPKSVGRDDQTHLSTLGDRSDGCDQAPSIEYRSIQRTGWAEEVVRSPERIKTGRLRLQGCFSESRPVGVLRPQERADLEAVQPMIPAA